MTATDVVIVLTIAVGLALTAWLAALETVLTRMSVVRALRLEDEGERGSRELLWLTERRATSLSVLLVVTVAVRFGLVAVVAARTAVLGGAAIAGSVLVLGLVSLALTEVAPRTLALRDLERVGRLVAGPARPVVALLAPVASVVNRVGRAVVRTRADVSGPFADDDELQQLLAAHEEDADHRLEADERAMIRSIIELGETVAREIMVPRPDMVGVDWDADIGALVNLVIEHGYSRLPVHRDGPEDIVGTVHAKDVLRRLALSPGTERWHDLIREPIFVPEVQRNDDLLRTLREQAVHQAIVIDEYGAVAGLVTIEDILEEIVGEIVDEHDNEAPLVTELDDGDGWLVDARLPVDDFNDLVSADLPDEGWDTVGGLVVGMLGRIPDIGERLEVERVSLEVRKVQGRRVAQVLARPRAVPEETDVVDVGEPATI